MIFTELVESFLDVRFQISWSLICDLKRILKHCLWNDFLERNTWCFRRNEASKVWMWTIFDDLFEILLKGFHPGLHEMYVLEHAPVSSFTSFLKSFNSIVFLTLSHRNIDEGSISNGLSIILTNQFNFWRWINTREEHEENWSLNICFWICISDVEWFLLNILRPHVLSNELCQSICKSIWSESS